MRDPKISFWKRFVEIFTGWKKVSVENPFPTMDVDSSHRISQNSIFWEKLVWSRIPSLWLSFQYPLNTETSKAWITWAASVIAEDSMLKLRSWADINSSVFIEGTNALRYIPWHEWYSMFTAVFWDPAVWNNQILWLYDGEDWFAIWYIWTELKLIRYREWARTEIDSLMTPFEGYDPKLWNVYKISYWYLWFAAIHFEIMNPLGSWVTLWEINYPNSSTETHIKQTFLPLRAEVENTTNNTNIELRIWSATAWNVDWNIIPWGINDPAARLFSKSAPTKSAVSWVSIAFRSKDTFWTRVNKVPALLKLISASSDGNKPVKMKLLKSPPILSATWADVNVNSVLEYSTDMILQPLAQNWDTFIEVNLSRTDNLFESVSEEWMLLRSWQWAVFYFESQTSTDFDLSIRWAELF